MGKDLLRCAKISRPALSEIIFRERLFKKLEENSSIQTVWISGPAGSGKTSLVSSFIDSSKIPHLWYKVDAGDTDLTTFFYYLGLAGKKASPELNSLPVLTPEYRLDISKFSDNFFTKLFSKLEQPTILILDNYQEISEDFVFHDLILDSIKLLPKGVRLFIVSRNEPSSKFSRLLANRTMNLLRWKDLRFTHDDFSCIVSQLGFGGLSKETLKNIYGLMDGWIAGLLYMLERADKDKFVDHKVESGTFNEIFLYLAEETFDCQDLDIKYFLLKTSLFPHITPDLAENLTGNDKAGRILTSLNRHNLFIEKHCQPEGVVYQYHPLFWQFLQSRMTEFFTDDELCEIKQKCATLLHDDDLPEEAAELFRSVKDYEGLTEVVVQHAPVMLAYGRHKELEKMLKSIPQEIRNNYPWILYWLGASAKQSDPEEATENFKKALDGFSNQRNMLGAFSAWIGTVSSIIYNWNNFTRLDPMIYWLESHFDHEASILTDEMRGQVACYMTWALIIRRAHNSQQFRKWVDIATAAAELTIDPIKKVEIYLVLANYYRWLGDQDNFVILLDKMKNLSRNSSLSSLALLKVKFVESGRYAWHKADGNKCMEVVDEALEIAGSVGIHTVDHMFFIMGACGALVESDCGKADKYLNNEKNHLYENHNHCVFNRHYVSAWRNVVCGNIGLAVQHADQALIKAKETGYVFHEAIGRFAVAQTLFISGKHQDAIQQLESFGKITESTESMILTFMFFLTKAQFSFELLDEKDGEIYLQKAMEIGKRQKYRVLLCWWDSKVMTKLCMEAIKRNIEPEYAKELISHHNLTPVSAPVEMEQWPWQLRIYTLGRFEIVINGKPIRLKGKSQQKPLNMLKALIALGGRSVPEFNLAEALWPDAEGDMQHQSLATTLHRLRRVLGNKDFINFQNGNLSLDPRYCWVDSWAFERLLSQAESESQKNEKQSLLAAVRFAEDAVDLYKGNFLPEDNVEYWCIQKQERLKSRFLRGVIFLGRNLEKIGEHDKAITHYLQALEIDPMVEEFYQRLMIYYQRLGRKADAVLMYNRCRKNFDTLLKVEPSTHTIAIYKSLLLNKTVKDEKALSAIKESNYLN